MEAGHGLGSARSASGASSAGTGRLGTRRAVLGGMAAGGAGVLAACGVGGGTAPQTVTQAQGEVTVIYATFSEPAVTRMSRQEADVLKVLPQIKLSMIPTNDPVGKLTT